MKWISDGSVNCIEIPGTRTVSYNTLSGSPVYNVRLEIPNGDLELAIQKLLGLPEQWPHTTNFLNVRAVSASLPVDLGKYQSDGDNQIVLPDNPHFLDMTYAPRTGVYVTLDEPDIDVYIDDILEPRNETHPLNNLNFIWGNIQDSVPDNKMRTLAPAEAPAKYEPGDTLTHTVEGWPYDLSAPGALDIESFQGTCNNADWYSAVLNRTFVAGSLLLKNIQITKGYTFQSFRAPAGTPPTPPLYDFSGLAMPTLKFVYEYKKIGWQKFFRSDPDSVKYPEGYYYIRHAKDPWDKYLPFALADHSSWLY